MTKNRALTGFECFVDMEGSLQIRTESLPSAPHLIDGPKGSNSQYYMEKAACLSTPFMLETEGSNLKLLNMQEVQRLAMETETVVQMRCAGGYHIVVNPYQLTSGCNKSCCDHSAMAGATFCLICLYD